MGVRKEKNQWGVCLHLPWINHLMKGEKPAIGDIGDNPGRIY